MLAIQLPLPPAEADGRAAVDLSLLPPRIDTDPGPQYADGSRDFALAEGVALTRGGRLWAAWIAGGDSEKGYLVAATSDDRGGNWSPPRLVIDPSDAPNLKRRTLVANLWCDPAGRLWIFFDQSMGYFDGRAGVWAIHCDDPDATHPRWSIPRRIADGSTLNKPTVLADGTWLLPVSLWDRGRISKEVKAVAGPDVHRELDDRRMAHLFASADRGETWTRRGGVAFPEPNFDEHMTVERRDGSLWMLARTGRGLWQSTSVDAGTTWSPPEPSGIASVNSRFFLRRLASGRLLLVKHGQNIDEAPKGRSHLAAFLSEDDGRTWGDGLLLDERSKVSYPDGVQGPDGRIYLTYDRNRGTDAEILLAVFSEEDIKAGRFVKDGSRAKALINKAAGGKK